MTSEILIQKGDCELVLIHDFFNNTSFEELYSAIEWNQHHLKIFGKDIAEPRLSQWYGPAYSYSGIQRPSRKMPPLLTDLAKQISAYCNFEFNSVLANLYREGQDSMGWHADNEPEIDQSIIASYSIGEERVFALRDAHKNRTNILLPSDSLLLMKNLQEEYQHAVPKTKKTKAARINLTFRRIKKA